MSGCLYSGHLFSQELSTSPLQLRNQVLSPSCSHVSTYSAIFINILVGSVLSTSPGEEEVGEGRRETEGEGKRTKGKEMRKKGGRGRGRSYKRREGGWRKREKITD